MKRHGNLFKKVTTFENLCMAAHKAMLAKKSKKPVALFYFSLENEVIALKEELESKSYAPRPYTQFQIFEPKPRTICSSDFRDRVVHHAICNVINPILEARAIHDSYACRVGKGSHLAVERCQEFTRRFRYYLKCDIRKFFESIDHDILKKLLQRLFKDPDLLQLLDVVIDHQVPGNRPGVGLPIGNLTSQHFANFYIGQLDHFLKDRLRIKGYVRYMDDFICFSNDKESLWVLLNQIETFVRDELKLGLKSSATTVAPVCEGVPFLGFRVFPKMIRIKRENVIRMWRKVRRHEENYLKGRLTEVELEQSVSSIVAHVLRANSFKLRRNIFEKSFKSAW